MAQGRIKSFDYSTGSGLIEPENGGAEVAVHFSALKSRSQRTLQVGQFVRFDTNRDAAGLRAINVEILADLPAVAPAVVPATVPATVPADAHLSAPVMAPANRISRGKPKLLAWGVGGVAAVGALFIALGLRHNAPAPPSTTAATPAARAAENEAKPVAVRPLRAPATAIATVPAPLQGEKFAQTRLRELSAAEADNLTPQQVQYALNEIYARHGYRFNKAAPRQQFARFAWYKPVAGQSEVASWQRFSALEKRNAELLNGVRTRRREALAQQAETERNYRAEQKRLAARERQEAETRRQVAQARRNEPEPAFNFSDSSSPDISSSDASSQSAAAPGTSDFGSSGDRTPTGFPIFTGPRGGRYHISKNGNKVYEKRR